MAQSDLLASEREDRQAWLSKTEAAALYRVTEQTIEDLIRDNLIPYTRRGQRIVLPRNMLMAALRSMPHRGSR